MEQLVKETLSTFKEYLNNLVPALEGTVECFSKQKESEGLQLLVQTLEGLGWCIDVVVYTKPVLETYGISVTEQRLKEILAELTEALQSQDYVLVADLLQYEILDFFNSCKSKLEQVEFEVQ